MQNFIKEKWIASWSAFSGFVQLRSVLEIFSCCTKMRRPQSCKCLPIVDPKKCYNPLSPPVLSWFISVRLYSVPQVEKEVKRTLLCGCCWDRRSHNWWIKEGPKRRFLAAFQKPHDRANASIYATEAYFELKKRYVSSIFKKSVLKLLDHTVYFL